MLRDSNEHNSQDAGSTRAGDAGNRFIAHHATGIVTRGLPHDIHELFERQPARQTALRPQIQTMHKSSITAGRGESLRKKRSWSHKS
jgi:hypothetical protein